MEGAPKRSSRIQPDLGSLHRKHEISDAPGRATSCGARYSSADRAKNAGGTLTAGALDERRDKGTDIDRPRQQPLLALLGPWEMSDLSPQSGPKRTFAPAALI